MLGRKLRDLALANTKMMYLNVKVLGLSGCPHPAIQNIFTTQDVKKLRLHLKFLTCDYLTNERLALNHPGKDPAASYVKLLQTLLSTSLCRAEPHLM